jgi:spermidine/putrescine transport system permease protein
MAYPLAYFMATRTSQRLRAILLVLVMIPFWSNFLVRTYAWRVLLSPDGIVERLTSVVGFAEPLIFTSTAIIIGLVYGYLPFMVLPLYAALERMDWRLVEAARDLYAGGWDSFWRITWPLSRPGVVAGSILVFIPSIGAYVTPEILGGARETMLGSFIVRQFLSARDFPFGSSLSVVVMVVMLAATLVYFRTGGRNL